MIMSVEELKQYIDTDKPDTVLESMLQSVEGIIRRYTNNGFQNRNKRYISRIENGTVEKGYPYILDGDTVCLSETRYNDGVYVMSDDMGLIDEPHCLVTKVEYPADVKLGAVNMIRWDLENRDKVGIQSETISRHSVTYFNMDGDNSAMGYPKSLLGFLTPYRKMRT